MERPFICIAGKNNIAVDILEYVIRCYGKQNVCVICNKTETGENSFQRSLRKFAKLNGITEKKLEDVYNIDNLFFLSLEFDRIIRPDLFINARLYNIHFSLLPKYKGMYTSAHPILKGENFSGVTLHKIDSGIDTGDVIDQEEFVIYESDDCKSLYLKYIRHGTDLILKNIDNLIHDKAVARPQNSNSASYFSRNTIDYSNIVIDLNNTANMIGRQIRAFSFRDYQLPKVFGREIIDYVILDSKSIYKPGTELLKGDSFVIISTVDYNMILYYDRFSELMVACENGSIDKVKEICLVKKHINEQDENGWSPLIKATYYNQIEIVKLLLSIGADINVKNKNGTNLLMYAKEAYINSGDNTLFKLYIKMGLSEKSRDFNEHDLLYYLSVDGLSMDSLQK